MNIIWYDNKFLFYTFTKFPVNSIETTLACGNYLIFFNVEVTLKINYFLQKVCKVYIWRAFGDIDTTAIPYSTDVHLQQWISPHNNAVVLKFKDGVY